jgi:hypothetical protein
MGSYISPADFVTPTSEGETFLDMSEPNCVANIPVPTTRQADLDEELRQAEADFASGIFVDLTIEELDGCMAGWLDESSK